MSRCKQYFTQICRIYFETYSSAKTSRARARESGEREKRESERRRQSELPADIADKPKRLIPVDPIISPFDSGEDKVPGEGTYVPYRPTEHPFSPDQGSESPGSPLRPRLPIPH